MRYFRENPEEIVTQREFSKDQLDIIEKMKLRYDIGDKIKFYNEKQRYNVV